MAQAETRSARVLGTSVDRLRGCWREVQVRKAWEAEATAPRLMAAVLVLGGSWIGREPRSAPRNCLAPCFGPQNVEKRLRRSLSEQKLMTWAHEKIGAEDCVGGKSLMFVASLHLEPVRLATLAGGLSMLSLARKLGRPELLGTVARLVAIWNEAFFHLRDSGHSNLHGAAECVLL